MKNIEKYTNTKDALDAYNSLNLKNLPFDEWLKRGYVEPRVPTLLEAAQEMTRTWESQWQYGHLSIVEKAVRELSIAIEREKHKPVRNCDVGTSEEQAERFMRFCEAHKPDEHQFTEHGELLCPSTGCELIACNYGHCALAWAQLPYEEGGAK